MLNLSSARESTSTNESSFHLGNQSYVLPESLARRDAGIQSNSSQHQQRKLWYHPK